MAETNPSGNTGGTATDQVSLDTVNNAEEDKELFKLLAEHVKNTPKSNPPGYRKVSIYDKKTGQPLFKEVTSGCCHGGEPFIPAGGFRAGGQDIPAGHQSGYGGHSSSPQTSPTQPKTEKDCFENLDKVVGLIEKVADSNYKRGKECCGGHGQTKKDSWVNQLILFAVVIGLLILSYPELKRFFSDKGGKDVEVTIPEIPKEDPYKQTDQDKTSSNQQSVDEGHIQQVELVEPEPLVVETYGEHTSADADLTLSILSHFSGPEAHNFRYLKGDSLDGQNKFVMTAVQVATLMKSGKGVRWKKDEQGNDKWEVYPATYSSLNQNSEAARMARLIGEKAKYHSVYQDEKSYYWVVNSAVEDVPSSSETDYSKAVTRTLHILMEEVKQRKIPSINGKVFFVSSDATSSTKSAGGKSMSNTKIGMVTVDISPLPNGIKKIGRGVKLHGDVHHGHDLAADCGDPVAAVKGGKVIKDAFSDSYGNLVAIYDGIYVWQYAHLKKRSHKSYGSNVKAGEHIAFVGNTGHTEGPTGCHLHLECWTLQEWNKREKDQKAQPNQLKLTAEVQIGPRLFAFKRYLLR